MPEVSNFIWDTIFSSQEWGKYPSESLIQFIDRNFYNRKRDEVHIQEMYGKYFTLKSFDFLSYSSSNKSNIVEEYIIIASKNE